MYLKLLPICLLAATAAQAQPTLTSAANNFVAGASYLQYSVPSAPQGSSGANVTWDFSGIGTATGAAYSYSSCNASTNCGTFPGSNMVTIQTGSNTGNGYWIVDNTRQALNGAAAGTTNIVYSNPQDLLHFPFTYNNSFSDTYAASFVSNGVTFNRSGTITVTADGYGTLKLPNGTFTNVLRVKRMDNFTDTWSGPTLTYSTEMYTWYAPNYKEYLLSKSITTVNGSVSNNPLLYTNQVPSTGVGELPIIAGSVDMYPNPARGSFAIRFLAGKSLDGAVSVMDLTGRVVNTPRVINIVNGMNEVRMSTDNLSIGVYMIRVSANGQTITRKLEVL